MKRKDTEKIDSFSVFKFKLITEYQSILTKRKINEIQIN